MLKVNDVRVGNFLNWKSYANSGVSPVVFIENRQESKTPFRSPLFQLESGANDNECTPIELTDEWFQKMGFEKSIHNKPNTYTKIDLDDFRLSMLDVGFVFDGWGVFTIKYVHQLQNLYHALTGVELSVS